METSDVHYKLNTAMFFVVSKNAPTRNVCTPTTKYNSFTTQVDTKVSFAPNILKKLATANIEIFVHSLILNRKFKYK